MPEKTPLTGKFWFAAVAFWCVVAIAFVVVFNLWPDVTQSTIFRAGSFIVVVGCAYFVMRRTKNI